MNLLGPTGPIFFLQTFGLGGLPRVLESGLGEGFRRFRKSLGQAPEAWSNTPSASLGKASESIGKRRGSSKQLGGGSGNPRWSLGNASESLGKASARPRQGLDKASGRFGKASERPQNTKPRAGLGSLEQHKPRKPRESLGRVSESLGKLRKGTGASARPWKDSEQDSGSPWGDIGSAEGKPKRSTA